MLMRMNTGGIASTNSFLIADETAKQAVLFDAPDNTVESLLDEAAQRGWDVIGLWLTHGHFDHFAGHAEVTARFPRAKVLIHALDEPKIRKPELQTRLFGLPLDIPPRMADTLIADNQPLKIGKLDVTVLHTPGHSAGHVVYYFPDEGVVVGGDLIIGGSIGRTDLPDSNSTQMETSVKRVMALPESTRLLGGHGDPTTLGDERRNNPFVREILGL